ncbi:MAG: DMT family transporter [Gammaproteobacteria bacterium]
MTPERSALLRLLGGAVCISFAPVFVQLVNVPPTTSAFYRTLIGGFALIGIAIVRKRSFAVGPKTFWALVLAGLLFALDLGIWHRSITLVGPGLSTLLANFQVFILALAGVLIFREKLRWELLLSIPVAIVGVSMIVGFEWQSLTPEYRTGVILGLLTAFFYASYVLSLRRARTIQPRRTGAIVDVALASVFSTLFLYLGAQLTGESLAIPGGRDLSLLIGYAMVTQVAGWVLISSSLPMLPASRVGLVLLLQPTLAYLWDVLFFDQPMTPMKLTGAVLALGAIWLGSRSPSSDHQTQTTRQNLDVQ